MVGPQYRPGQFLLPGHRHPSPHNSALNLCDDPVQVAVRLPDESLHQALHGAQLGPVLGRQQVVQRHNLHNSDQNPSLVRSQLTSLVISSFVMNPFLSLSSTLQQQDWRPSTALQSHLNISSIFCSVLPSFITVTISWNSCTVWLI